MSILVIVLPHPVDQSLISREWTSAHRFLPLCSVGHVPKSCRDAVHMCLNSGSLSLHVSEISRVHQASSHTHLFISLFSYITWYRTVNVFLCSVLRNMLYVTCLGISVAWLLLAFFYVLSRPCSFHQPSHQIPGYPFLGVEYMISGVRDFALSMSIGFTPHRFW